MFGTAGLENPDCRLEVHVTRLAIIGCGQMATAHWQSISRIDDPEQMPHVRCLVDLDRTGCAELSGAIQAAGHEAVEYRDLEIMLDKEAGNLDAVIIATPDWIHHEQTIRCLRAGLHVHCEKPMSNRIEWAREMVKVAQETGRLLEIGFQRCSNPRYLALRDGIVAGYHRLGRLSHAYARWHRSITLSHLIFRPSRRWSAPPC